MEYLIILALFTLLLFFALQKKGEHIYNSNLINPQTSTLLKAFCCILIVCHHYALRTDGGIIRRIVAMGGGTFALVIFLLLSSYGIAESEKRKPTDLKQYLFKRCGKLVKPYFLVTVIAMIAYWFIGAYASSDMLLQNRVSQAFVEIGQHRLTIPDGVSYMVGLKTFDGAMWFVGVTLYSYLAFGLSKTICLKRFGGGKIEDAKCSLTLLYSTLLILFAVVTYSMDFPAHYYRNLWALILGLWLSLYGKSIVNCSSKCRILAAIALNVLVYIWLRITQSGDLIYLLFANVALASLWLSNRLFFSFSLRRGNFITMLAGISYMVYLIHIKVLTIEWWYIGYKTLLLPLAVIVLLSYLFSIILRKI